MVCVKIKLLQFKAEIKTYENVNFQEIDYRSQISRIERMKIMAFTVLMSFGMLVGTSQYRLKNPKTRENIIYIRLAYINRTER